MGDSRRKPFSTFPPPAEEGAAALITFGAYAGTFTCTGEKVIHHIEVAWVQNFVNTDQERSVTLQGDRLILRGGFLVNGVMSGANSELVWERLKPKTTDK
jgi:Lipocalin-like domain